MKLKKEFEKYAPLVKDGFLFDPDEQVFFTDNKKRFTLPEDYSHWKVENIDKKSYLTERLKEMGASDEENTIKLFGGVNLQEDEEVENSIFQANKNGDISIMQYSLHRKPWTFKTMGTENNSSSNREEYHEQIRLAPWNEKIFEGKYDFKKAKVVPFWTKYLIEQFEDEESTVDTLIITEGQIKTFVAGLHKLPVCGLTSITHYKNKDTGTIDAEIIEFIKAKKVKKVVILWDGDCRNVSTSDIENGIDISRRPNLFYKTVVNIREGLQDFFPSKTEMQIFFATIKSDEIDGNPKGIDDLLLTQKSKLKAIKKDFLNIGEMPGIYLHWQNISNDTGLKKLVSYFNLTSATSFFQAHKEKIGTKDFIFKGTTFQIENDTPTVKISASLKQYKRIGTDYYRIVKEPIPYGKTGEVMLEEVLVPWKSETIKQDHGAKILPHIEKFLGFTNQANHINYQQIINEHWNLYQNIDHQTRKGDFPHIEKLLIHLFDEQYTMVLDYITLLFRYPSQKLPVVCLVSKEQSTGKSTFMYLLKLIFKQNMALISNNDLTGDFNSHWTSKLIVASEETMLEKKDAYEKIKSFSTAKTIMRNEKNKSAREIPCMMHFIFGSNHEDDFIKIDDYDSRLWIRKVKSIKERIKGFDEKIENEIPEFVNFIQDRQINYKDVGERLYFHPRDFQTDAFRNVVKHSEPSIIKEIRTQLTEMFYVTGAEEIKMTVKDIKAEFGLRHEHNYLNKEIQNYLKPKRDLDNNGNVKVSTYEYMIPDPTNTEAILNRKGKGRYFIFERSEYCENN